MDVTPDMLCDHIRCETAELLNRNFRSSNDARSQIDETYRNLVSRHGVIHELLDQVAEAVENYSAMMCECSAAFGAGERTGLAARERIFLEQFKCVIDDDEAQFAAVTAALAAFGQTVHQASDAAMACGDADTSDFFKEVSRDIDYHLWLAESHLGLSRALRRWDSRRLYPASLTLMRRSERSALGNPCNSERAAYDDGSGR